ncbi:MAG: heparinase II/III family protein, partial [Clostridia bacterium]|nr:heparinase II/III family protein [Clostridia bacterium]
LFLASYGEDGCCAEGLSYWHYGFGLFLTYADAMRNYSETHRMVSANEGRAAYGPKDVSRDPATGRIDYFRREDVKRSVGFLSNMRLLGERSVSFSDGPRAFAYARSLFWLLKREYPDRIAYPALSLARSTYCNSGFTLCRHFLWSDPDATYGEKNKNGTVHYPETSWFIKNTARYSFAAKAGHNAEPHNHNDVGSFLLVTEKGESFIDPGAGEYVRQYFLPDTRYDFLVNRSLGHSVPYINGKEQVIADKAHPVSAPVSVMNDDSFAFDMANAYGLPTLTSALRRFDTDEEGITITDTFTFSECPESVRERFVCVAPPEQGEDWVRVGGATLTYDPAIFTLTLSQENYKDHARRDATLYFVDLDVKETRAQMTLSLRIDVRN